jgi:hypothetical protein
MVNFSNTESSSFQETVRGLREDTPGERPNGADFCTFGDKNE